MGQRGEVQVNSQLQTSVKHIYAAGDVKSGLQFTYISLDDFRILRSQLFGDGTTENRAHSLYIYRSTSIRVGLTATEARF